MELKSMFVKLMKKNNIPLLIGNEFHIDRDFDCIEHYNNGSYVVKRRNILKGEPDLHLIIFGIEIAIPLNFISEKYAKQVEYLR